MSKENFAAEAARIAVTCVCLVTSTVTAAAQTQPLPAGWSASNIGRPAIQGSATYVDGTFSITGAGTDVWGTSDQFMFVHRQLAGNGVIVARVASLQNTNAWSKAGLMIRETLAAGSPHGFVFATPASGMAFAHRAKTGRKTFQTAGGAGAAPVWLKLERLGTTLTASRSSDAMTWSAIGTITISMATDIYVGLAVTSHDAAKTVTATFSGLDGPSLPSGWTSTDVGGPALKGTAMSTGPGLFTVSGAGTDVWDPSDQFQFLHQQRTGDVDVVARVATLQNIHPWTQAGVMVRTSLEGTAGYAAIVVTPSNGISFIRRQTTGGASSYTYGDAGQAPVWVRLQRRGSLVTASRSSDGVTWTTVGEQVLALSSTFHAGLVVTSHDVGRLATSTFDNVAVVAPAAPSGWTSTDVGGPAMKGTATAQSGTLTVSGGGRDIWDPLDEFQFLHQPRSGDVELVARLATLQNVHPWTQAGVMIRGSTDATSAYAAIVVTPSNGISFIRRATPGGASTYTYGGSGHAPMWLKLQRRGSVITAFRSTDGVAWTTVGEQALTLPATFHAGLAVTSHDVTRLATSTFDNVALVSGTSAVNQPPSVSLTAPASGATFTAPADIAFAATASDADGTITRVDFYAGATLLGTDTSAPYAYTWLGAPAGSYPITAVARDNAAATTVSATRDIVVVSGPLPRYAAFVPSSNHATAVDRYFLEIFPAGADPRAANPVATRDLGKPAVVKGECVADISATTVALPPGSYIATITAIGAGGATRSAASPIFQR